MRKIIKCGTLIDGTGRPPVRAAVIVVSGNTIEDVRELATAELPAEAELIDLSGFYVCPGLIDAHLHTSFNGEPDYWDIVLKQNTAYRTLVSLRNVNADLAAGFTTIRCLGEKDHLDIDLRNAIRNGIVQGPRVVAAGQNITVTGGHADVSLAMDIVCPQGLGGVIVDGPDEVRKAVRQQVKAGADLVKLLVTGGVMSEASVPGVQHMSYEEISAAVEEAHRLGRRVAAHAQGTRGIKEAVKAGVDSIEHGHFLDQEAVDMMAEKGVYYVPTFAASYWMTVGEIAERIPPYAARKAKVAAEAHARSFEMARKAGVKIVCGTDAGSPGNRHGSNAVELELLVEHGMSPMEAIMSATKVAAECLGVDSLVGTIERGKLADIVAVKKNPLEDISAFRDVLLVMKDGQVVKGPDKSEVPASEAMDFSL
ncbi:MAG TPA: amidohydrolase family protein [Firmicutes bacterium]|nr:amidohydrolase family protein [Candidatus Fermentithermobacillaceae bacterium]